MKAFCSRCRSLVEQRDFRRHLEAHADKNKQPHRKARRARLGYHDPDVRGRWRR
jgi:hypothetical protein